MPIQQKPKSADVLEHDVIKCKEITTIFVSSYIQT